MSDLPTIDQAFDEAVALTIENPLAEEAEAETQAPKAEPKTKPEEKEVEDEADDKAETEAEETFADKPSLEGKTPEELEAIYKDWQKSYTQKRQAEKEQLRALEEKLSQYEAQTPKLEDIPINWMTPQQFKEYTLAQAKKQVEAERDNAYIESQEKAFYEVDKRLDDESPDHDEALFYSVVGKLTKEREAYEAKNGSVYGFDFVGRAKDLIKAYDEGMKQKVQDYLKKNNERVRSKVEKNSKTNPKTQSAKMKKAGGLDLEDAFEEALTEVKGTFGW